MVDRPWMEVMLCAMCGAWRPTFIGPFDEDGREAICCRVCQRWLRWATAEDLKALDVEISVDTAPRQA